MPSRSSFKPTPVPFVRLLPSSLAMPRRRMSSKPCSATSGTGGPSYIHREVSNISLSGRSQRVTRSSQAPQCRAGVERGRDRTRSCAGSDRPSGGSPASGVEASHGASRGGAAGTPTDDLSNGSSPRHDLRGNRNCARHRSEDGGEPNGPGSEVAPGQA